MAPVAVVSLPVADYEGWRVRGRPWMTLVRGHVVLTPDGEVEPKPGFGQFLPEAPPVAPLR